MAIKQVLGHYNRLVHRVMRHRNITTLFRADPVPAARAAEPEPPSAEPRPARGRRVVLAAAPEEPSITVYAELVAPDTSVRPREPMQADVRPVAAAQERAPRPHQPGVIAPSVPDGAQGTVSSPSPTSAPAQRRPPPSPTSGPRPVAPGSEQQDTSEDTADSTALTDQVWQRLQTIFRRHQEVQETEATAPDATPTEGAGPHLSSDPTPPEASVEGALNAVSEPRKAATAPGARRQSVAIQDGATEATTGGIPASRRAPTAAAQRDVLPGAPPSVPSPATAMQAAADVQAGEDTQGTDRDVAQATPTADTHAETIAQAGIPAEAERQAGAAGTPPRLAPDQVEPVRTTPRRDAPEAVDQGISDVVAPPLATTQTVLDDGPPAIADTTGAGSQMPVTPAVIEEQVRRARSVTPPQDDAGTPDMSPPAQQPLENVWQVQRLAPTPEIAPRSTEPTTTDMPSPAPPATARETIARVQTGTLTPERTSTIVPAAAEAVAVLENVAAARPTRSSIETIAPRRPRPDLVQSAVPPSAPVSAPARAVPAEATSLREPTPIARPESPARPGQALPEPAGAGPTAQSDAAMVATEIGPLPSDLWMLIGETPPAPATEAFAPEPRTVRSPRRTGRSPRRTGRSQIGTMRTPPQPDGQAQPSVRIQRSIAGTTAQAPTSALQTREGTTAQAPTSATESTVPLTPTQSQAATEGEEEGQGEPTVDIDQLARRVYAELKRRLAVEWERLRNR